MKVKLTTEPATNWKAISILAILVLMLIGCSRPTKIPVQVERPATLNTTGIKRIAVMPFEYDNSTYRDFASYATTAVADRVRETNRFTLVDASEVRHAQKPEDYVDAMIIGKITRAVASYDITTSRGYYDKKTGRYSGNSTTYYTSVEVEFTYSLKIARDGRLIGPISKKGVQKSSSGDGYPSAEALLRLALNSQIATIRQDIAPYRSTEIRTFADDKTGNEVVKQEMKDAIVNVKAQNYKLALDAYLSIYERYKNPAAAENASILYEAMGDTESALSIMQRVYEDTGNPTAQLVIARLRKNLSDKEKVAANEQEIEQTQSPLNKVTAFAIEEIQKVLPTEPVVWIYSSSPGNTMVEAVVDNITADFIRKGIGIVDRQNTALIGAEQKLQVSGVVNDEEIVKLGNAAGAKSIVTIGITGSGAMRRLQVRVLDIERGVPVMQSDTDERWSL